MMTSRPIAAFGLLLCLAAGAEVFAHVASLFPAEYIHIGAGDVPKDQWKQSTSVQARMHELGIVNEARLQRYFFERIGELTQKHRRRIVGWDSIFGGGVPADSVILTARGLDGALGAVASGYEVIASSATQLDLSRPQSAALGGRVADVFEVPRTAVIKAAVFYNGEPLSRTTSIDVSSDVAGSL